MFPTYQTPKLTKQLPQKIQQHLHQKTLPQKSLSPSQIPQMQSRHNKSVEELNPQTPQKLSITKGLKVLNIPSQPNENSFRKSSSKNLFSTDSPLISHNKENGQSSRRIYTDTSSIDSQSQIVLQENKKLNEMIQRLFKEKQELVTIIDKQKSQQQSFSSQQTDSLNLNSLKERIERLEAVIDLQSEEILEWKQKYRQACEQDERANAIDQMESQIMKVVEENERLNNLGIEKDKQINELTQDILLYQKKQLEYEQKMKDQSNLIIAYEEDTKELKKQYKNKLNIIEKLEQQQQEQYEFSQQTSFHDNSQIKDQSSFLDQLNLLEQQLSELSTQYTSQVLENQRLLRQSNNLKEELIIMQKALDDVRNSTRGAVNPKFQEANKCIKLLRERVMKQLQK